MRQIVGNKAIKTRVTIRGRCSMVRGIYFGFQGKRQQSGMFDHWEAEDRRSGQRDTVFSQCSRTFGDIVARGMLSALFCQHSKKQECLQCKRAIGVSSPSNSPSSNHHLPPLPLPLPLPPPRFPPLPRPPPPPPRPRRPKPPSRLSSAAAGPSLARWSLSSSVAKNSFSMPTRSQNCCICGLLYSWGGSFTISGMPLSKIGAVMEKFCGIVSFPALATFSSIQASSFSMRSW